MAVTTTKTNKPINPRGNDQSPKGYNRAALYSGKALDFDGVNDYVDGGTLDITGYTQMSVSFYMNVDTTTQDFRLISIRYSGADDIRIFHSVSIGGGVLNFSLDDGDVDNIGVNFETNQWYHVVMTHDGATLKAYFNGVEQASTASTFDYANADGLFYVGRYTGGVVTYYDGEASNVKIFNTALTAAQVSDLYNNPEKVVPTGVEDTALKLWLPMMEGAGTTAYDGSGNGNHGTISGATYVHGVGAPVAQSAVIDWNKGSNYAIYSEELDNAAWAKFSASVDFNQTAAPDGRTTADEVSFSASATARITDTYTTSTSNNKTHTVSVWAKVASGTEKFRLKCTHSGVADYFSSDFTVTTEWQRFTFSQAFGGTAGSGIIYAIQNATDGAARDIFFWGFQLDFDSSTAGPYVRTGATAQTSDVLLPQGLTTGRDITGVNLFENVRKQGALNLDGNSWAEVHDNGSLDFGTGSFTLEAWVRVNYVNQGSAINCVISLGGSGTLAGNVALNVYSGLFANAWYNAASSTSGAAMTLGDWAHLVMTYDGTNVTVYENATQVDQDARTAANVSNSLVKYIGRDSSLSRAYSDQIAQPRIYNRALTAEEVQRIYDAGKNIYTN